MGKAVSIREFARLRGVSHTAVRKAIDAGRITTNADGKIDPDVAGPQWEANTDQSKQREPARSDERSGPENQPRASEKPKTTAANAYQIARAVREEYAARLARLDYESKAGLLVSAEKVKLEAFQAARLTRDTLLNIPNKISHELAAETDPTKIHSKITEQIHHALEELAAEGRRRSGLEEAPNE